MKKILTVIFIIAILLPMLVYLHPFTWGLRKPLSYEASEKTKELVSKLNTKYDLEISGIGEEHADTLWYFIDVRNDRVRNLKNFRLTDYKYHQSKQQIDQNVLKQYADDFIKEFEHKHYFDSIIIVRDTLIYKAKI